MAERAGFEPAVEFDPYDGLANRSFRPLRHLSASVHNMLYTILRFPKKIKAKCQKKAKMGNAWGEADADAGIAGVNAACGKRHAADERKWRREGDSNPRTGKTR